MTKKEPSTARLHELIDRADIYDCMLRYARGMDRRDRPLLRSAYHDDAIDEHVGFVGPVDDFMRLPTTTPSPVISTTCRTTRQSWTATSHTLRRITCSSERIVNPPTT